MNCLRLLTTSSPHWKSWGLGTTVATFTLRLSQLILLICSGMGLSSRGRARDPVIDEDDLHQLLPDPGDESPDPVLGPRGPHSTVVPLTPVTLCGPPSILVALPQPLPGVNILFQELISVLTKV